MDPHSPTDKNKPPLPYSAKSRGLRLRLHRALSGGTLGTAISQPTSPTSPSFNRYSSDGQSQSLESLLRRNGSSSDTSQRSSTASLDQGFSSPGVQDCRIEMTSPAIKAANQSQKENGKSSESSGSSETRFRPEPETGTTAPFTAWWRVFKLAQLLMQQGC